MNTNSVKVQSGKNETTIKEYLNINYNYDYN